MWKHTFLKLWPKHCFPWQSRMCQCQQRWDSSVPALCTHSCPSRAQLVPAALQQLRSPPLSSGCWAVALGTAARSRALCDTGQRVPRAHCDTWGRAPAWRVKKGAKSPGVALPGEQLRQEAAAPGILQRQGEAEMPSSERKPTGVQPKQRWLRSLRRPKVSDGQHAAAPGPAWA